MTALPRLVIAAPASGHGKTTVATGLMAALVRRGHVVSGHKVGPDYIDPGYHALATGRPGRNLDPHLVGEDRLVPLLLHGAAGADLAVVEGVMGLYDGQLGTDGFASTAHVAAVTRSPVVLVVDISHASRTIAATVHGLATWSADVDVVGVVLNKAGSPRHAEEVRRTVEGSFGDRIPVLGVLHRDDGIAAPSRHLGLVPAAERAEAAASLDRLAAQVAERIDLDAVVRIARSAPGLEGVPWDPSVALAPALASGSSAAARSRNLSLPWGSVTSDPMQQVGSDRFVSEAQAQRPLIAIAGGRAFTFRYAETTELLEAAGCEVVTFDPTTDPALPEGTQGLYLGGGFPEVHANELSGNEALRGQIREAVAAGLPTVAECAGLLYLCRSVDGSAMVGAIDADAAMAPRLTLAYRTAVAPADTLLTRYGEQVTGHEFHRTRLLSDPSDPAWDLGPGGLDGSAGPTLHASYLHTHWAGHPHLAARFAAASRRFRPLPPTGMPMSPVVPVGLPSAPSATFACPPDPLRHHGDVEATDGLVDLAVNVYDEPRPTWLDEALAAADPGRYPDARPAREALAALHGRAVEEVLATAGAAEAFGLVARARTWRRPVVVHPQFTEPDVALREAGHRPEHVLLSAADGFALDPRQVPGDADLVVLGNPTNPTGVRHPAAVVRALLAPGRLLVVDEAFDDDGVESLAGESAPGLLVVRSLTKIWSIPGVRAGYVLGDADTVRSLARVQTPWSVSGQAVAALLACSTPAALLERDRRAARIAANRDHLVAGLTSLGVRTGAWSQAPFVLVEIGAETRIALRGRGFALRRADTFPGLDDRWSRIAVRSPQVSDALLGALAELGSETAATSRTD